MFNNFDTQCRADLRKKKSIQNQIIMSNLNIESCMVILTVFVVLLLSIISIITAQNSIFI